MLHEHFEQAAIMSRTTCSVVQRKARLLKLASRTCQDNKKSRVERSIIFETAETSVLRICTTGITMGFTKLLVLFVAAAISTVAGREDKDGPVIGTHQSPFPEPQKTTVTVDWLFSTGYGISESVSVAEAVPKTTICSQQCSVVTLSTVIRYACSVVSQYCLLTTR